jgi:hypothetical protein
MPCLISCTESKQASFYVTWQIEKFLSAFFCEHERLMQAAAAGSSSVPAISRAVEARIQIIPILDFGLEN